MTDGNGPPCDPKRIRQQAPGTTARRRENRDTQHQPAERHGKSDSARPLDKPGTTASDSAKKGYRINIRYRTAKSPAHKKSDTLSKHRYAPVAAASLEASPRSHPARSRSPAHHARPRGARGPAGCTRSGAADNRCRAACNAHGTAADQRGHPPQRPPLVLIPAPAGRALVQRGPQPGQLPRAPPAHRPARPLRGQRRRAPGPPAAPPLIRGLRAHPQIMGHLHRLHILLVHRCGRQPHLFPPGPPRSGQATTIGISHTYRRRPAAIRDHAGTPTVIRQTQTRTLAFQSL